MATLSIAGHLLLHISLPLVPTPVLDRQTVLEGLRKLLYIVVVTALHFWHFVRTFRLVVSRDKHNKCVANLLPFGVFALEHINFNHESRTFGHEHVRAEAEVFMHGKFGGEVDTVKRDSYEGVGPSRGVKVVRVVVLQQVLVAAVAGDGVKLFDYTTISDIFSVYGGVALTEVIVRIAELVVSFDVRRERCMLDPFLDDRVQIGGAHGV